VILVNSAKFIVSDLQADFGKIPAAFVPIAGNRLYTHQISALKKSFPHERIYISLPIEYEIPQKDLKDLKDLEITVIRNLSSLSLKESISHALKKILPNSGLIRILHGDTLFSEFPLAVDLITVSEIKSQQSWFSEETYFDGKKVWSGYFAFSDYELLMLCLDKEDNFETAILSYDEKRSVNRSFTESWQDLGHAATYYLARQNLLVTRAFNRLHYTNGVIVKSGEISKINAEIYWYRNIPFQLRKFVPQIINDVQDDISPCYSMEYFPLPALSEILVFGNQPLLFWKEYFSLLDELFDVCRNCEIIDFSIVNNASFMITLSEHVSKRINSLEKSNCLISQDDKIVVNEEVAVSIRQIISKCLEIIGNGTIIPSIIHGDLCLSNILFESRMNKIRIIDPRGQNFEGKETIYGDQRYDLAKLAHSLIGHYDYIIAGYFNLENDKEGKEWKVKFKIEYPETTEKIADIFYEKFIKNQPYHDDVVAIMILLFITMTPLHSEDSKRQLAFLSNSILLYNRFFAESK